MLLWHLTGGLVASAPGPVVRGKGPLSYLGAPYVFFSDASFV